MFALKPVVTQADVQELAQMAHSIWHEYFPAIISEAQIDYMVEKFQSIPALQEQMERKQYRYFFLVAEGAVVGYTGVQDDGDRLFLSKLYVYETERGKGYARRAVDALCDMARAQAKKALHLTVNRNNAHAIAVYTRLGFQITGTQVADIGKGFVMDDFLMELTL